MEDKKYRWIKGERFGTYEIYKDEKIDNDITYINFHSGRRINKDILSEFLEPADDYDEKNYDDILLNNSPQEKKVIINNDKKFTIKDLITDQLTKNKNSTNITISINIPILKKEFFDFLQDSNEDVINDLISIITEKYIDKNFLKQIVLDKINNYYYVDDTTNNTNVDYITVDTVNF